MKKKKKGITVLEVIVTLFVMGMVIALIYPIFLSNNKKIIETDMRQTLQMEASNIETKLTELLVQSRGIEEVFEFSSDESEISKKEEKLVENVRMLKVRYYDDTVYDLNMQDSREKDNVKIYKLILTKDDNEIVLSDNVKSFKVIAIENANKEDKLGETKVIRVIIDLYNKKGITTVEQEVNFITTFRNKREDIQNNEESNGTS